ncbi:MAG: hypothetical protein PVH91_08180 [Pseudomonadales bacterium]|jgi:hypothetical protein
MRFPDSNPIRAAAAFCLLLSPLIAAASATAPPPTIGVSPSRLEIDVTDETTTGSATVLNLGDRPIHVKSSAVSFDLDEANEFHERAPEPGSLATAMMINPVEFTIPPKGSQTVRFAIMRNRLVGQGEHRAMLFFSELVDTSLTGVKLNFRLGMPIYATVGERNPVAVFNDVSFDAAERRLDLDISSIGNVQVRPAGFYLWWPVADFPQDSSALKQVSDLAENPGRALPEPATGGRLVTKPVFAGTRRTLTATLQPPPDSGNYKLVVHVDAGDKSVERVIDYAPSQVLVVNSE